MHVLILYTIKSIRRQAKTPNTHAFGRYCLILSRPATAGVLSMRVKWRRNAIKPSASIRAMHATPYVELPVNCEARPMSSVPTKAAPFPNISSRPKYSFDLSLGMILAKYERESACYGALEYRHANRQKPELPRHIKLKCEERDAKIPDDAYTDEF